MNSQKKSGFKAQKEKIPHPYKVPENFFSDFKEELLEDIDKDRSSENNRVFNLLKNVGKYAAILVFSFFALKGIVVTFQAKQPIEMAAKSNFDIDAIYSQISEEDLTEFIVDESNVDISEILEFKIN